MNRLSLILSMTDDNLPHASLSTTSTHLIWKTYQLDELDELAELIATLEAQGVNIVARDEYTAWADRNAND